MLTEGRGGGRGGISPYLFPGINHCVGDITPSLSHLPEQPKSLLPPISPPTLLLTGSHARLLGVTRGGRAGSSLAPWYLSSCVMLRLGVCCWLWWCWLERTHGRGLMTDWGHQRVSSLEANNNTLAGLHRKTSITTIMTTHSLSQSLTPLSSPSSLTPDRAEWAGSC